MYDFTSVIDRHGRDALAVDHIPFSNYHVKEGLSTIPMWIADQNFATLPDIQEAIIERAKHPMFGYYSPKEEYYNSILFWQREKKGLTDLKKEEILYENGVLGGIVAAVNAFTHVGDAILLHSPVYIGFLEVLKHLGRKLVFSPLVRDAMGVWRMDYADMEQKIRDHHIRLAVFCNPHNPCGRVWEREELETAMKVFADNNCLIACDEIWSDLILPGNTFTPILSISQDTANRTMAFHSVSKTFNLSGMIGAYGMVKNPELRFALQRAGEVTAYNSMNIFSQYASIAAFSNNGLIWVDELTKVLGKNVEEAYAFFRKEAPEIRISYPQGTYMMYLDCGEYCRKYGITIDELQKAGVYGGVIWQDGRPFQLADSIRLNVALPEALLHQAFERLMTYVFEPIRKGLPIGE